MVYGLWLSAGGLQAQEYRQTVSANNLANADTPGFKPDRVAFIERLNALRAGAQFSSQSASLGEMTGGAFETPVYTDYSQGGLVASSNRFDVAIEGPGFLTVQTADGPRYTRDGRMTLLPTGALTHTSSGGRMLDADGRPIVIDPDEAARTSIGPSGEIRQGAETIARLALVDFGDRRIVEKDGGNLFTAGAARPLSAAGRLRQGYYESSGVEPTAQLVDMIAASRAYEMNATMITLQDESLGRVVNDLGRVG